MQEDFNEARVYIRKRTDPGVESIGAAAEAHPFGRPEARLATVTFALRPLASRVSPQSEQEAIAWIAGRIGVFFGHAPEVTIQRDGSGVLSLDAGPFPLPTELEAFATAISIEAAHIGMECSCTAGTRDGSRLMLVEGEFVITE